MSGTSPLSQAIGAAAELSIKPTPANAGGESFVAHLNREVARQERMEDVAAEMTTVGPLVAPPPFEIHPAKLS